MDTSKKYIKMCGMAIEIQSLQPKDKDCNGGSWYYDPGSCEVLCTDCLHFYVRTELFSSGIKEDFWLPRQDQLQEIYFDYISKEMEDDEDPHTVKLTWPAFVIASINELKLFNVAWYQGHPAFESYEQLWLALIMISSYNKYWDDGKKKWMKRTNGF